MFTPQVRALHLQSLVAALDAFGPQALGAIQRRIDPHTARRVAGAGRLEWIPAEMLVAVCAAARAEVGDEALESWGSAALAAVFRAPLARAFYEAALRVGGRDPCSILPAVARAWPLLYRGCGDLVVTRSEPGLVRIVHTPVPPLLRDDATVLPLIGALGSVPEHCGRSGGAVAEWEPASPRFVYVVRWEAS